MLSPNRLLLMVLCCAFVVRSAIAIGVQRHLDNLPNRQFLIEGDAWGYWELGKKLAKGEAYEIHQPPRQVTRMPGFPLLLAACIKLFGERLLLARIVLAGVGTAGCYLVYLLGRELFDERTGIVAAAIVALSPTMAGFSPLILSETLFATCLVLSLWCLARLVKHESPAERMKTGQSRLENGTGTDRPDRSQSHFHGQAPIALIGASPTICMCRTRDAVRWLVCGMAFALACYVRPSWLLAAPLFALVLMFRWANKRRAVVCVATLLAGLALALTPWTVRNYFATEGRIVVTTLWLGPSLYDGLSPEATGDSNMAFFDRDHLLNSMSEYDVNRHYTRLALDYAASHPCRSLQLAGIKLGRFWKPWPNAEQFRSWWMMAAVCISFLPMLALALGGAWSVRHQPWTWLLTLGPVAYFSLLHMVFVGSLRYRLPAEYPLCVLSAVGLLSVLRALPRASSRKRQLMG